MTDNQFCIGRAAGNNDVFSACRQGARKASGHRSCGEKSEEMRLHRKVAVRFSEATGPCDAVRSNINAAVGRVSHGLDV